MRTLAEILPEERILSRLIDRIAFASDAGFYHLIPLAVVKAVNETEIIALFKYSQENNIPLVFRTGGTSLSGQSITNGILVDLSQHWGNINIEKEGEEVRVQPGIIGAKVNNHLLRYGRKIGPDPSSISAAMIGGILSNNASGMCCGTQFNSYHTMRHISFILPDGNRFTTAHQPDYARFESEEAALFEGLATLRHSIHSNDVLFQKIRNKYRIKNTIGYALNAFLDYEHPLDIFSHLLIGAEGTLAFIAEAVLETIPDLPFKSTAMLYFTDIRAACKAIEPLTAAGAAMVELMDRASLRAVENIDGIDPFIQQLPASASALLVEFQAGDQNALTATVDGFLQSCTEFSLLKFPSFSSAEKERNFLWKIRKGLFPSVGAVRKKGTTVILEDIAFPVPNLGDAIADLQVLFEAYKYPDAIIFGHAKDGNIHFVVTQAFDTPAEVGRYDAFIREVVDLVVKKYDGSLKAEHGTGRNMAPFVETEWGGEAYAIMNTVKKLADPQGLLNPGVIINENPQAHITDLKELPEVESEVDKCIECGYCEPNCPSRDFTTSPRRRIVLRRALAKMKLTGRRSEYKELLQQFNYDGLETCAVDGLCAISCPVDINTGDLVKRLRRESHSPTANAIAVFAARNFGTISSIVRGLLKTGLLVNKIAGRNSMLRLTRLFKKAQQSFPLWSNHLLTPPHSIKTPDEQAKYAKTIVYFPTCISRVMGNYPGKEKNSMESFLSVCQKSQVNVRLPQPLNTICCSQIFSSKGYQDAHRIKANEVVEALWTATGSGKWPVVLDVSSCAYTLKHLEPVLDTENRTKFKQLTIWDTVEFLYHQVVPSAIPKTKKRDIVLHPVCSLEKMNISYMLRSVAAHFADQVTVPVAAGCCGMAGDRGFIVPGLTASATHAEAAEVCAVSYDGHYSATRTCELALSQATGRNYESILYLVDECL
ncbi:FAD-binding and (Fe-S)-binding domain-containing protein [Flavihumibacter profundi]|uniref:FAD-binding and (Fe-S)-binding domain-containing protein n=1 Tax=Flavihumibacter profundi TaxID=2716883 RepID=UPI001CC818CD|nr:FAD-binding and (Fe-S)-binding domain-containing protein [Flavihumibacter profundi]MBZ5856864.1 FAD-binding oxidoreductase [Flavihumibacter profundi]